MQIQIDQTRREIKTHGTYAFPVRISCKRLSEYQGGAFFWHWHPQAELTLVLNGQIRYQVNDRQYLLRAGEGLFCNANMPHTGSRTENGDCRYVSITFDPKIVYGFEGSLIQTRYLAALMTDSRCAAVHLTGQTGWQQPVLAQMEQIHALSDAQEATGPFRIQILLSQIICALVENLHPQKDAQAAAARDRERLLAILTYLHAHYAEKVTLADVARQISLCQSECCRFFKRLMHQSVFEYLLRYRLEQSLTLLAQTDQSVSAIATQCGFSTPSYFSRHFGAAFDQTPRQYRAAHQQKTVYPTETAP